MAVHYHNHFIGRTGFNVSLFQNEKFKIDFQFQGTTYKEIEAISFYLANIMAYEHNDSTNRKYDITLQIQKNDNDYTISSDVMTGYLQSKGNGIIYLIENGIEIFYKEIHGNSSKKCHYQITVEDLLEDERMIQITNMDKHVIVEGYLVNSRFEILNARNKELANIGFKPLFKAK